MSINQKYSIQSQSQIRKLQSQTIGKIQFNLKQSEGFNSISNTQKYQETMKKDYYNEQQERTFKKRNLHLIQQ